MNSSVPRGPNNSKIDLGIQDNVLLCWAEIVNYDKFKQDFIMVLI